MGPICIRLLPYFCWLFDFVFSLGCVYLHSHLHCTFDAWVLSLIFIYKVFFLKFKELAGLKFKPDSRIFESLIYNNY